MLSGFALASAINSFRSFAFSGALANAISGPKYRKRLEKDVARWKDVVRKANIKIDVIG